MELTVEQKIKYADVLARVMLIFAVIFIGYGLVAKVMAGDPYANTIAGTGLVFGALCGLCVYVKKTVEAQIEAGKTYHGGM